MRGKLLVVWCALEGEVGFRSASSSPSPFRASLRARRVIPNVRRAGKIALASVRHSREPESR